MLKMFSGEIRYARKRARDLAEKAARETTPAIWEEFLDCDDRGFVLRAATKRRNGFAGLRNASKVRNLTSIWM